MAENGDRSSDTDGQGLHKHTAVFKLPSTPPVARPSHNSCLISRPQVFTSQLER
uniref:Uncharacterized protein n=1 Tax=Anguilla anguilla TaxID=7936 RepID=A0A0E9V643_ANGAN